jgi:hypothetical protein
VLDCRRQGGFRCSGIAEPDGPLRDALADGGEKPLGNHRTIRPIPRVGFIVTNLSRPAENIVASYN